MPRIIIVGGGPAGISAAQALAKDLTPNDGTEVVVFEKSKYYFHAVGTPRAVVDAAYTKKLFVPYDNAIPAEAQSFVRIERAIVTRIAPSNEVEYTPIGNDDEMVAGPVKRMGYDYLVVATGSTYTVPLKQPKNDFKRSTTESMMAEARQQIENAQSILVVSGGATGASVVGEIKSKFPDKNVTLLEGKDKLVGGENVREKFRVRLLKFLKRLDVNVVLGERLTERLNGNTYERRTLSTDKGRQIVSDIQLLCGGFNPTTELIKGLDESLVTPQDLIKVNDKLQLDNVRYSNIYALGDANNNSAPKHMLFAGQQGTHLGKELALVVRKTQTNVAKAFPKVEVVPAMIPLGPNGGVSQLPFFGGVVVDIFNRVVPVSLREEPRHDTIIGSNFLHGTLVSCIIATACTIFLFLSVRYAPSRYLHYNCASFPRRPYSRSTSAVSKYGGEGEYIPEDDDEWGIVHNPSTKPHRPQSSHVQLNTTYRGIKVSLAVWVSASHRAPPGLRLQRTRVAWAFLSVDGVSRPNLRLHCSSLRFVQVPVSTVGLVSLAQFDAYVTDRLDFAARRHDEWTKGSRLCWSPYLATVNASGISQPPDASDMKISQQDATFTRNDETITILQTYAILMSKTTAEHPRQHNENQRHISQVSCDEMKGARQCRVQPPVAEARYMNYEQSISYTRRREANVERRRALQSAPTTSLASSRRVSGSSNRFDCKYSTLTRFVATDTD
ncbi:unnamed protein product [Phytophthora fragariaefolia]|uniref:Unnamed protein product n=1 Tax=Phytophthora fragariaefolia TaxID=1490495 RepID=A0A9W6YKR5_9STRA|nr:unnamed protein product [Phytophthora fragariaefolia]